MSLKKIKWCNILLIWGVYHFITSNISQPYWFNFISVVFRSLLVLIQKKKKFIHYQYIFPSFDPLSNKFYVVVLVHRSAPLTLFIWCFLGIAPLQCRMWLWPTTFGMERGGGLAWKVLGQSGMLFCCVLCVAYGESGMLGVWFSWYLLLKTLLLSGPHWLFLFSA